MKWTVYSELFITSYNCSQIHNNICMSAYNYIIFHYSTLQAIYESVINAKWGSWRCDKPCSVTLFCCKLSNSVYYSHMLHNINKGGCSAAQWGPGSGHTMNEWGPCPSLMCVLYLYASRELEQVSRLREVQASVIKVSEWSFVYTTKLLTHYEQFKTDLRCRHNAACIIS